MSRPSLPAKNTKREISDESFLSSNAHVGTRVPSDDGDDTEHSGTGFETSNCPAPDEKPRPHLPDGCRQGPPPAPGLGGNSPICETFLTFATEMPAPAKLELDDGSPLPPCPDLRPYACPAEWSVARKSLTLTMSCLATFMTAFTPGVYSPPAALMANDFGTTRLVVIIGITTFCVGFAITPMVLAPVSEIRGRRPVFVVAGAFFALFQALSSVMPNIAGMLICRFFVGVGASVFSTVVGGVLADIWANDERNTPMTLFAAAALVGTGSGPLVGYAMIDRLGPRTLTWKWIFWVQVIMNVLLVVVLFLFFPESRRPVILSNKAKALNMWYEELESKGVYGVYVSRDSAMRVRATPSAESVSAGTTTDDRDDKETLGSPRNQLRRIRWVIKENEQRASLAQIIAISVQRPFHLLLTEPIVLCFSSWAAFSWAVLYLSISVVPFIYGDDSSFTTSSRVYIAIVLACSLAAFVSVFQESLLKHPQWRRHDDDEHFHYSPSRFWALMRRRFPAEAPESRLYFSAVTAVLLPVGLFVALLTEIRVGSNIQAAGFGLAIWGVFAIYLATFNYIADSYTTYASSGLAAQGFCRNMLGGAFPLVTGAMFDTLGAKGTGGLLGGIAILLTIIPWVLIFFGEKIRSKSRFASALKKN